MTVLKLRDEVGLHLPKGHFECKPLDLLNYKNHLKYVCDFFNEELAKASFANVSIECDEILACSNEMLLNDAIRLFTKGDKCGQIWDNVILNCVDTLKIIRDNPGKSIVLQSPMLSGKTTYSHALQLILMPIIQFIRGTPYWAIRLVPNKCGLEEQSIADYKMFCSLYDKLHIRVGRDCLTLSEYAAKMRNYFGLKSDDPCVKRINQNTREEVDKILDRVYDKKGNALFIGDEPDYGSKHDGEFDKILRLSKSLHDRKKGDLLIGTTATEKELSKECHIVHQKGHLYAAYCGPNCSGGDYLDPDFPDLPSPEIKDHKEFSLQMKLSGDLSFVWPGYYENESSFLKHVKKQMMGRQLPHDIYLPTDNHRFYQRLCDAAIIEFLETVLVKNNYKNMPGAAIRFVSSNYAMHNFAYILRNALPNVQVLEYNDGNNKVSFESFLKDNRDDKPFFVILVTGSFRMGDYVAPNTIGYWLEFPKSQTFRAILQGFYGRACGAHKGNPPAVWIANKATVDELRAYLDSRGASGTGRIPFCERTEITNEESKSFHVKCDANCKTCQAFLTLLEKKATAELSHNKYNSNKFRGGGLNVEQDYEKYKQHVQTCHNVRLLGVREVTTEDIDGKEMQCGMKTHNNMPFFSCYRVTSKADQRGTARTDRNNDYRKASSDKINYVLFSLLWLKKDKIRKKVVLDSAKFRCVATHNQLIEKANKKSMFEQFSAYANGEAAAKRGEKPEDNNNAPGTQPYNEWLQGYHSIVMAEQRI